MVVTGALGFWFLVMIIKLLLIGGSSSRKRCLFRVVGIREGGKQCVIVG